MPANSKDEYNAYMREYMLKRYHRRMDTAREQLGGKCASCESPDDLHLHHANASTKTDAVANLWSYADDRFWIEVAKCILLCGDCHRAEHASTADHGTARRYWRGCRCQPCTTANTKHTADYRWNRRKKN